MNTVFDSINSFRYCSWFKAVAITGGPCGGKSTFLKMAIAMLSKYGFKVIVVPEIAREFISSGIAPWDPWRGPLDFQEQVLLAMLEREVRYKNAVQWQLQFGQQVVALCDRGLADCIPYCGRDSFTELLAHYGVKLSDAIDRYAAVVHLVTAANGAPDFYVNDDVRLETPEQACKLDEATLAAWLSHQHVAVVGNSTDFPTKINRALLALRRTLKMPEIKEIEKKFLVHGFQPETIPADSQRIRIEQHYLVMPDKPGIECRVRTKGTKDGESFYYTEKTQTEVTGVRGEHEEQITSKRYHELIRLHRDARCKPVEKARYKFQKYGSIFELDVYEGDLAGLVVLEVEFKDLDEMSAFAPPTIFKLEDVTSDERYSNRQLAEHGIPKG